MTAALPSFVQCKLAQAAPPAARPSAGAATSGLVGALVGAGLLGGERLLNAKKDPHASKDPAARRREVLKRALLGGLIGGAGGAAYGHERQPGGRLSLQDAGPKKPGNAIPAVPASVIGAILGAGALGGGRAITRAMDPAESEDLEEGSDSVWRRALLGAGLGGAAGYGLSWHTRPGGYLSPGADSAPGDTTKTPGPDSVPDQITSAEAAALPTRVDELKKLMGQENAYTGAIAGALAPTGALAAGRAVKGLAQGAVTRHASPQVLRDVLGQGIKDSTQPPLAGAAEFVRKFDAAKANHTPSLLHRNPDFGQMLREMEHNKPGTKAELLAAARTYRGDRNWSYDGGALKATAKNLIAAILPEKGTAPKTTFLPSVGDAGKRARQGRLLPIVSSVIGSIIGNSRHAGYQKELENLQGAQ